MGEDIGALTSASGTILLGRRTHEMFAPAWRDRTAEDDPGAPFFDDTEKLVVGSREPAGEWANSRLFGPYDADQLRELKESNDGDIFVSGSGRLVRGLLADGLLDELHLFVYPLALGSGERLFADQEFAFAVTESRTYPNGVVHLCLTGRD